VLNLLTSRRSARRLLGTVADAVRSVVAPSALVVAQQPATAEAPEPAGLFTEDELPPVEDIERAALGYDMAADNARSADRAKRKYRKLLDRLPADGIYGAWRVYRKPSARQTVDLDAVRRIFEQHGLGEVPMRDTAPSLRVERVAQPAELIPA
jgi:hypothetical protein